MAAFDMATLYWSRQPPEPSARLLYWLKRIGCGFRPNRRLRSLGYHERAAFYGVYIWEQLNILDRALDGQGFAWPWPAAGESTAPETT